jgi:phosphoribosylformylglycinamidine (FGAM) synthase PurS component
VKRAVSIALKIPDNTAYTALVTLRRLCVDVERIERSEILICEADDAAALRARVMADETLFNPNKHRVTVLDECAPRSGEVWIVPLCHPERSAVGAESKEGGVSWRLFDAKGAPVERAILDAAIERLLCNPAIDRAVTSEPAGDRDIPGGSE